jgi:2Fe-2S ferredoxin
MPSVTYIEFNGTSHTVEGATGSSLMQTAVDNAIPGIDADCGGACACATCHIFLEPEWLDKTEEANPMETTMLQLAEGVSDNSRLACQITLEDELDGIVVRMPESQH